MEKIVVIENYKELAETIAKKLQRNGFEVESFSSIIDYEHIEADLYLMDLKMETYAFDLIKHIRDKTDKPIVMFSWHTEPPLVLKSLELWADIYMCKLMPPNEMIARLKAILRFYKRLKS